MPAPRETIIIGHRNPDTDSCVAAVAYAEFKRAIGEENVVAGCAGMPGARTEYLFNKFQVPLPRLFDDVFLRVAEVMETAPVVVYAGQTLLEAMEYLRESKLTRLPVIDSAHRYIGMIGLFDLADRMFQHVDTSRPDPDADDCSIVGRSVETSCELAAKALNARLVGAGTDTARLRRYQVYVGAMSLERLDKEILAQTANHDLAVVVGDRVELHARLVKRKVPLIIVTGNATVDLQLLDQAQNSGVTILQTSFDSATAIRRLKFSTPVESMLQGNVRTYRPQERLVDIRKRILAEREDNFPVVDQHDRLVGEITQHALVDTPPRQLILVDHNELAQAVKGAEDLPVVEIVDHHRLGIAPTDEPIRVVNDIVGSTSTLIAEFFQRQQIDPTQATAALLIGGIITDTLLLRSPTTTPRDRQALDHLRKLANVDPETLMHEIFAVGSLIATVPPAKVIASDRKRYESAAGTRFFVAQIEEADFVNLEEKQADILAALEAAVAREDVHLGALLVTNIVREDSLLMVAGEPRLLDALPFDRRPDGLFDLPGILSRKKQLLPILLKLL